MISDISIECFEKARRNQSLTPVTSALHFDLLYEEPTQARSPPVLSRHTSRINRERTQYASPVLRSRSLTSRREPEAGHSRHQKIKDPFHNTTQAVRMETTSHQDKYSSNKKNDSEAANVKVSEAVMMTSVRRTTKTLVTQDDNSMVKTKVVNDNPDKETSSSMQYSSPQAHDKGGFDCSSVNQIGVKDSTVVSSETSQKPDIHLRADDEKTKNNESQKVAFKPVSSNVTVGTAPPQKGTKFAKSDAFPTVQSSSEIKGVVFTTQGTDKSLTKTPDKQSLPIISTGKSISNNPSSKTISYVDVDPSLNEADTAPATNSTAAVATISLKTPGNKNPKHTESVTGATSTKTSRNETAKIIESVAAATSTKVSGNKTAQNTKFVKTTNCTKTSGNKTAKNTESVTAINSIKMSGSKTAKETESVMTTNSTKTSGSKTAKNTESVMTTNSTKTSGNRTAKNTESVSPNPSTKTSGNKTAKFNESVTAATSTKMVMKTTAKKADNVMATSTTKTTGKNSDHVLENTSVTAATSTKMVMKTTAKKAENVMATSTTKTTGKNSDHVLENTSLKATSNKAVKNIESEAPNTSFKTKTKNRSQDTATVKAASSQKKKTLETPSKMLSPTASASMLDNYERSVKIYKQRMDRKAVNGKLPP